MVLPISVLSLVTNLFEVFQIRYIVVGSFASSIHGLYRATADIDILADIRSEHVDPLYTVERLGVADLLSRAAEEVRTDGL